MEVEGFSKTMDYSMTTWWRCPKKDHQLTKTAMKT